MGNNLTKEASRRNYQSNISSLRSEIAEYEALKGEINSLVDNLRNCAKYVSSCYEKIVEGIQSEAVISDFERINEYAENIKRYMSSLEGETKNVSTKIKSCEDSISYYQRQLAKL